MNIVFGSLKTGGTPNKSEFDYPVMRVEAWRGKGTSRRVMFNKAACQLMSLDADSTQKIMFGFAQAEPGESQRLFVINTESFIREVEHVTYNTSKNYARYSGDETTERGKSISSTRLVSEIRSFMNVEDESVPVDFKIVEFSDNGEAPVYELISIVEPPEELSEEDVKETEVDFDEVQPEESVMSEPAMNGSDDAGYFPVGTFEGEPVEAEEPLI